jgi:parvulin-like peptidyl-prolyl isomerase
MQKTITVTPQEIIHHLKMSCMIPEVTEKIIIHKIILDKAKEIGIKPDISVVQKTADAIRVASNLITADDTFAWLERNWLSAEDFEQFVLLSLFTSELANNLFVDKVEKYFFENQLNYMEIIMYEVVLDDQDLAMELFYAVREGEISFFDVAHKYIQDPELRRHGGYQGIFSRKDLKPEIAAAVFAATPPEIIKPIVTSLGIHLIFVEEIARPQLNEQLSQQICFDLFNEWISQESSRWEVVTHL